MRRVLIISPYFPPSNAADMQRIRTSLPYFKEFGWDAAVVTVDEQYSEIVKDDLLVESIPADCKVYKIKASDKRITAKIGFGSLAFRSLWHYRQSVSNILKAGKFDLIYFSTTQFPVCVLGPYWKRRFGIPYVIDMQDPWYSDYYKYRPASERPAKYHLVYALHKIMEAKAMAQVDGLISVSNFYIDDLKNRYPTLTDVPAATITFGAFRDDLEIALNNRDKFTPLLTSGFVNVVYVGRGGADMHQAITPVFEALKKGLSRNHTLFAQLKFWFIGTSYAPADKAKLTILPLAEKYGVEKNVIEITGRISYYHAISTLLQADALFIPGSGDPKYTASKIYPYLLTKKPLLAIFNKNSSAVEILDECTIGATVLTFSAAEHLTNELYPLLEKWANRLFTSITLSDSVEKYSARNLTGEQAKLFGQALNHYSENR